MRYCQSRIHLPDSRSALSDFGGQHLNPLRDAARGQEKKAAAAISLAESTPPAS
jgi:hypothetical protein